MALGMEVGLAPDHIVLNGDPAPLPKRDRPPIFVPFYSARNARIASAVLATAIPSVCLSVRPSIRLSVRPSHAGIVSKRRHVARCSFAPLNSKMCLVLYKPKNIPQGRPLPSEILAQSDLPTPEGSEF